MNKILKFLKKQKNKYSSLNYGEKSINKFYKQISIHTHINTALDIGVDKGRDLNNLDLFFDCKNKMGIDLNSKNIDLLSRSNIKLITADIEKDLFPIKNNYLDLIISNQVFEHIKNIFGLTHEIARCLKIGGFFILGIPNLAAIHNRLLLLLGLQPTCIQVNSAHIRGFTKSGTSNFFSIFPGLKLIKFYGENIYPLPPQISYPITSLFPKIAIGNFYLFQKTSKYNNEFIEYPKNNPMDTNF
jgi:SAM-dependent methyltransferase